MVQREMLTRRTVISNGNSSDNISTYQSSLRTNPMTVFLLIGRLRRQTSTRSYTKSTIHRASIRTRNTCLSMNTCPPRSCTTLWLASRPLGDHLPPVSPQYQNSQQHQTYTPSMHMTNTTTTTHRRPQAQIPTRCVPSPSVQAYSNHRTPTPILLSAGPSESLSPPPRTHTTPLSPPRRTSNAPPPT